MTNVKAEEAVVISFAKKLLLRFQPTAQRYVLHVSGQAIAWLTVLTHDVSKVDTAVTTTVTLVLTSTIRRVNAWLAK